jgi:hypothetical protein
MLDVTICLRIIACFYNAVTMTRALRLRLDFYIVFLLPCDTFYSHKFKSGGLSPPASPPPPSRFALGKNGLLLLLS